MIMKLHCERPTLCKKKCQDYHGKHSELLLHPFVLYSLPPAKTETEKGLSLKDTEHSQFPFELRSLNSYHAVLTSLWEKYSISMPPVTPQAPTVIYKILNSICISQAKPGRQLGFCREQNSGQSKPRSRLQKMSNSFMERQLYLCNVRSQQILTPVMGLVYLL